MGDNLHARLQHFRSTHPMHARMHEGHQWRYFDCGAGPQTLLMLPGAPGIAEMAFQYIAAFEPSYRVIAPSYPATVATTEDLIGGLAALLEATDARAVHVAGGSYSGLVAQYLVSLHPTRIASLMLGDTGLPRRRRARTNQIVLSIIENLPRLGLHAFLYLAVTPLLFGSTPTHRFWQCYFRAIVSSLHHTEFANRVRVWIDMDRREHDDWAHLPIWRGPTMIIETTHDPLFLPAERAALKARYPAARRHTFAVLGHTTALTRADDYAALMAEFMHAVGAGR